MTRLTLRWLGVWAVAGGLGACATTGPAVTGLTELLERPAERALLDGLKAYEDGQYPQATAALRQALQHQLVSVRDRAMAHKLLAFIECSGERYDTCEAEFRQARLADPGFTLSRAESGHPLWGPVYKRVAP